MNQVIFSDACEQKMLQSHERDQLCGTTHWFLGNDGENAAICNSVIVVMSSMYVVGVDHTVSSCGKTRRKAHAALCERGRGSEYRETHMMCTQTIRWSNDCSDH